MIELIIKIKCFFCDIYDAVFQTATEKEMKEEDLISTNGGETPCK